MIWKLIGQSTIGSSHIALDKACDDSIKYGTVISPTGDEVLVCCVSDGAGSAKFASTGSDFTSKYAYDKLTNWIIENINITDAHIYSLFESIQDELITKSEEINEDVSEFSCTLLGCVLYQNKSIFFQLGDGAIIRDANNGNFTAIWWPLNGEYLNSTFFVTDANCLANLNVKLLDESIREISIFTDGLQMSALNMEDKSVHLPFFENMFKHLRRSKDMNDLEILNSKLNEFLSSQIINEQTDDDKTLFLATSL
jgi:hypothetical protein